jgi:nucleoside-diphosphate-sugar epimerase
MSRVVVIGGSGRIGTYLLPRLVEAGFEVVNVSRGLRKPLRPHSAWKEVETVTLDRETEEAAGTFGAKVRDLKPDIVIDVICFTVPSVEHLVGALEGYVQHFLHTGGIWVHGHSLIVPTSETQPRKPFEEFGIRKAAIEAYLIEKSRQDEFPATVIHPGHLVGPGWIPLNPVGNFNPGVFGLIARGEELALPNFGLETLHHVHVDDVARAFLLAIGNWSLSVGEIFHVASPNAMTLRGYAEGLAAWFGKKANLVCLPWPEWKATQKNEDDVAFSYDHIAHSPNCSIAKAQRVLGYHPRYSSLEAICEAVAWLMANGVVRGDPIP